MKKTNKDQEEIHPLVALENDVLQLEADKLAKIEHDEELLFEYRLEQKRYQLLKEIVKNGFRYLYFINENKTEKNG